MRYNARIPFLLERFMSDPGERPDFSALERPPAETSTPARTGRIRRAGRSVESGAGWLADRIEDLAAWLTTLVRYLPARLLRLALTLAAALTGTVRLAPGVYRAAVPRRGEVRPFLRGCARRGGIRAIQLLLEFLDLIGVPELFAFVWRMLTRTSPLTGDEIATASQVLGPRALRYQDVRVAQGGILRWIFARNGQRAFATFHTVNLPEVGYHQRSNTEIVAHEIVHVYQYERAGSRYFAEALLGQHEEGYGYGGPAGLAEAARQGKRLADYNREQQAQIAQDYLAALRTRGDLAPYQPFIEQLRQGKV
jgi:hypothetical protein